MSKVMVTKDKCNSNVIQNSNNKNIIKNNKWLIILTFIFGIEHNCKIAYGSSEIQETLRSLVEKLSNIENKDRVFATETADKILKENYNYDIVVHFLEEKKEKFKNYITKNIILNSELDIYYDNYYPGVNYSKFMLESIDKSFEQSKLLWENSSKISFLKSVLFKNNKTTRFTYGEKNLLSFFNKQYESNLITAVNRNFSSIINNILETKIRLIDVRSESLGFIRRMSDCVYNNGLNDFELGNIFNKNISKAVSNSSRLSRNLFAYDFIKSLNLFNVTDIPILKESDNPDEVIFEYFFPPNDNKKIKFKPKKGGINAGYVIDVIDAVDAVDASINNDEKNKKKEIIIDSIYIKKYYGSTKSGSEIMTGSSDERKYFSSFSSLSFNASKSRSSIPENDKKKRIRDFDMKEPLLYSILESLNLSPKVKFFINPYIINGFYIATKNLEDNVNRFLPISEINIDESDDILYKSLNQIDLVARFLLLGDLHGDNFGFTVEKENKKYKSPSSVIIVDFTQPTSRKSYIIEYKDIGDYFLHAVYDKIKTRNKGIRVLNFSDNELKDNQNLLKIKNMLTLTKIKPEEEKYKLKYFDGFQALKQFNTRIEDANLPQQLGFPELIISKVLEGEEIDDKFDKKLRNILAIQTQHIKNLMLQQRGTDDKPEEIMLRHPTEWIDIEIDNCATASPFQKTTIKMKRPRTNAELIGFKLGKKPEDSDPNEKPLDYLDEAFEDLDNYCQGIMCNYKNLKKFITEGYNKYFDEQGNLKLDSFVPAE